MGGKGSGRYFHFGTRATTEDCPSIDVRHWQRDGLLIPYQSFNQQWFRHGKVAASIGVCTEPDRVILTHYQSSSEDWEDESYPVYLDWTNCNLGGQRPWFLCPAFGCDRRVAILYEGGIFACRHCCQLAYSCQREGNFLRALRRMNKICERLGGDTTGIVPRVSRYGRKPKGMHWRTYERLTEQYETILDALIRR